MGNNASYKRIPLDEMFTSNDTRYRPCRYMYWDLVFFYPSVENIKAIKIALTASIGITKPLCLVALSIYIYNRTRLNQMVN